MKTWFLLLVLTGFSQMSNAQLNSKVGETFVDFFDITPDPSLGFVFKEQDNVITTYTRPEEDLHYLSAQMSEKKNYIFFNNRLYKMFLYFDGPNGKIALKDNIEKYGEYDNISMNKSGKTTYKWYGTNNVVIEMIDVGSIGGYEIGWFIMIYDSAINQNVIAARR